jgi:beta-lactamase class A
MLRRIAATFAACAMSWWVVCAPARATYLPQPLAQLHAQAGALVRSVPGDVAFEIEDLTTGISVGYRENASMPAASVIKVPVMVQVFAEIVAGRFTLQRVLHVRNEDRDYGWGDLAYAPTGAPYTVDQLLHAMIDRSDNTAANMLIRLIGVRAIDHTMRALGLRHTWLGGEIRTDRWSVRTKLRTSPADMVRLLSLMARGRLIDAWASREMIAILKDDEIDGLLPEPLPHGVPVAHKTGSLGDTLNDVGIVYASHGPYAIAVMTTHLDDLDAGTAFVRALSLDAYEHLRSFARWRRNAGLDYRFIPSATPLPLTPDLSAWGG